MEDVNKKYIIEIVKDLIIKMKEGDAGAALELITRMRINSPMEFRISPDIFPNIGMDIQRFDLHNEDFKELFTEREHEHAFFLTRCLTEAYEVLYSHINAQYEEKVRGFLHRILKTNDDAVRLREVLYSILKLEDNKSSEVIYALLGPEGEGVTELQIKAIRIGKQHLDFFENRLLKSIEKSYDYEYLSDWMIDKHGNAVKRRQMPEGLDDNCLFDDHGNVVMRYGWGKIMETIDSFEKDCKKLHQICKVINLITALSK